MIKKLNSEQLQVAIDENSICNNRELSKIFHVSHITTYGEMKKLGWKVPKAGRCAPPPTRFVRNQQATSCNLLCFTAFS
ncbi:unnamed protein product [Hymenolepis diminuta]|uniref:Uncharacterized protein n=1 Tax=Hymenolepis diminuta TaxID=6216 RepID=A0A564YWJ5_HYMDI|nr:unnamed protein product [Hymenolepis diminuta]